MAFTGTSFLPGFVTSISYMKKRLLVIGGGAAGFFCAINAARLNRGLEVIIAEKSNKLLAKVKVSGGGRCNVTHAYFDINAMSRQYPRGSNFVKRTFHRFFTTDTISWFEEREVRLKTEKDGRMFPDSDSSQTIINCLLKESEKYGVEIKMNTEVKKVNAHDSIFNVQFLKGENIEVDYVCIASGGYPKSSMFDWLKELGHDIADPVPSLFTFNMPGNPITKLMGITVGNVKVKIHGIKLEEQGPLLITHWGLSGPVILRLSAWGAKELATCNWQFSISVNWLPEFNEQSLREKFQQLRFDIAAQKLVNKNPFGLPSRLWEFHIGQTGINTDTRWADLSIKDQNRVIKNLCEFVCLIKGKTTFKEEFVTAGGIRLDEIDPQTMMSKKLPNLFFAGEVMNVDAITGGYNFQHAWTSGFIAADSIAKKASG